MADASLGTAVLRTKLDTTGLKTGLNQAKSETEKFGKDAVAAIKGIGAAFGTVAASQGVRAYVSFMRSAAQEANLAATAADLFEKAVRRNNESVTEGANMVQRLSDRFGVAANVIEDAATTMLRQGATLEQVEKTILTAGASAAAAGFDIATAFENVTTAVVSGNSVLLRSSGIIAGLGEAERAYAREVGKTVEQLTEQEKIQARVNAIYHETRYEIEDLDRILQGLPRAQAEVTRQMSEFRQTAGDLALKVITPLTEGFGTMLRIVNDLPTPVKNAGIAMAGAATGATALATGIVAIKAALTGLSGLGLLSFGPAGWVVLGVTAVAGLAAALAGRGDSLRRALDDTKKAIASGDRESMTGAFDELIKQARGPLKEALQGIQADLRQTGDVGVAEAQRILTQLQATALDSRRSLLGLGILGGTRLDTELARAGGVMGVTDLRGQVLAALNNNELTKAIDLLNDAMVALIDAGMPRHMYEAIQAFHADVAAITAFQFTPASAPATTPSGAGDGGGGGTGTGNLRQAVERTWQDVLADLDRSGTEAMRRAAFEGTDEAFREAAQTRVRLINTAISELLSDPHYGLLPEWVLEDLRARREVATAQAQAPTVAPRTAGIAALPDPLDQAVRLFGDEAAETLARATRSANVQAARDQMAVNARNREAARAIAADTEQAMADAAAAHEDYLVAIGHTDAELARFKANAAGLAAVLKDAADQSARMDLFAAAQARYGIGDTGLAGTSASARGGIGITREQLNAQAADVARDTVLAVTDAYLAGAASIDDVQTAVDALTTLTPLSVKEINDLTQGVLRLERAANNAAAALQRAQDFEERGTTDLSIFRPFLTPEQQAFNQRYAGLAHRPRETGESDKKFIDASIKAGDNITGAAATFSDVVLAAGHSFGGLITNILEGDTKGAIKSGFDLFGDIGAAVLPGFAPFIKLGTGLMGDLFSNLFGGGRGREADRAAAEARRVGNVPAININFTVNQQNTYSGGPSQPENEQAFRRQANTLWEELFRRHLGPRLDRIEQRLGIAGAPA